MKIVLAADGAGAPLLKVIADHLASREGVEVLDASAGPAGEYYADVAARAAGRIVTGEADRGIFFCGTGIGVAISANKVPGIRAAQTHDAYSAVKAATSNNAQVITLGARVVGPELAKSIVDAWLHSSFDHDGPSAGNVRAIERLERDAHARAGVARPA